MYSLNVPVPGSVSRLASDLEPRLTPFETVRDRHSLLAKRFEDGKSPDRHALRERLRPVLRDAPAFELRISGVGAFESPPRGPGPVVYLSVESPGLRRLHDRLVDAFGAVEGMEGEGYVPHVTLARGGDVRDPVAQVGGVESVTWTASSLDLWSSRSRETVASIPLLARE